MSVEEMMRKIKEIEDLRIRIKQGGGHQTIEKQLSLIHI